MEDGRLTAVDVPILGVVATANEERRSSATSGPTCAAPKLPDLDVVVARMSADPDQPLGGRPLDQRHVAGFGNVYAVELPFIVGVSPHQPVGSVDGLLDLLGLGAAVIRTNAERGPQNTTGRRLHAADHWIYARRGRPCPLCGTGSTAASDRDSPWKRVDRVVPACQPLEPRRPGRPRPGPPTARPPPRPPPSSILPACQAASHVSAWEVGGVRIWVATVPDPRYRGHLEGDSRRWPP